jgi:hypothetical protein
MSVALMTPELQLSPEEAEMLASSIANVARHYDMGASAKTLDWVELGMTAGGIYGTRAMMIVARRKVTSRRPGPGHNGGPAMNGHDPAPAAPEAGGDMEGIVFPMMRGKPETMQ